MMAGKASATAFLSWSRVVAGWDGAVSTAEGVVELGCARGGVYFAKSRGVAVGIAVFVVSPNEKLT
jgi:hypothetical protein